MGPVPSNESVFGGGGRLPPGVPNGTSNNRDDIDTVQAVDNILTVASAAAVATSGQSIDSEEDLVAPTEEFRRTALISSKQKVCFLHVHIAELKISMLYSANFRVYFLLCQVFDIHDARSIPLKELMKAQVLISDREL